METKLHFQFDTFSILARSINAVLTVMEDLKRSKFSFSKHLDCRQWRSETDIQRSSLPPIQNNEKKNSKLIITGSAGKQLCPNRPPTPNPARQQETLYSWGRTSRMSPSNSSQRLSLSLDLRPVIEGANSRRYSAGFVDNSPEAEWSPRPCIRSLPPSPTVQRSHRLHRSLRRLSSDSEHSDDKFKDDRIMSWIRDVSEKTHLKNSHDDDEYDVFECSLENDDDTIVSPGLPVIQEGHKI